MKENYSNFRGLKKITGYIVTVYEGLGTNESPGREVEYIVLDDMETVVKLKDPLEKTHETKK